MASGPRTTRSGWLRLSAALVVCTTLPFRWTRIADEGRIHFMTGYRATRAGGVPLIAALLLPVVLGFLAARMRTPLARVLLDAFSAGAACVAGWLLLMCAVADLPGRVAALAPAGVAVLGAVCIGVQAAYCVAREASNVLQRALARGPKPSAHDSRASASSRP